MRAIKVCILFFLIHLAGAAQQEGGLVKWLTFKEAQALNRQSPKPLLVDIYTDWCGWCKHMMKTTYANEGIANYINTFFYPVKFDAETKDTIEYNGVVYKPTSPNPKTPHQLALKFLGTSLSYPSTVFVANNYEFNLLTQGYLDEKKIQPLLVYTVENVYKTSPYEDFAKSFERAFFDTASVKPVKSYSMKEVEQLQKKKPKKVLVNIYANFCNSCKVQNKLTFSDTSISNYISKHFYLVNFDAEQADTIMFKGDKYFKTSVNGYPLHTLALKITNNRLVFPTIAVLDAQHNTLDALNSYLSPASLKPILIYYAEDKYKTTPWADFYKAYTEKQKK